MFFLTKTQSHKGRRRETFEDILDVEMVLNRFSVKKPFLDQSRLLYWQPGFFLLTK